MAAVSKPIILDETGQAILGALENIADSMDNHNPNRRTQRNITGDLANLATAVAEQDLAKYGYSIGDYFVGASGYYYYLADMDTFYGGYNQYATVNTHHIGIVVDTKQERAWHSSSDVTNVGYNGSSLKTYINGTVLNNVKSDFRTLFGGSTGAEHLLSHQKLYTTAFANWAWTADQVISALTEVQVFGASIWSGNSYQQGEGSTQLEIFRKFAPYKILNAADKHAWLRSLASSSDACAASYSGLASYASVTASCRVSGLILFH